jgi:hypothetical protein
MIMPTAERGVCLFLPRIREFAIRMDGFGGFAENFSGAARPPFAVALWFEAFLTPDLDGYRNFCGHGGSRFSFCPLFSLCPANCYLLYYIENES